MRKRMLGEPCEPAMARVPAASISPSMNQQGPPQYSRIRVVVADDHSLVRAGLAALLSQHASIEVIGEAVNGEEAIHLVGELRPDVVVMDVTMPVLNGIEATRRITAGWPGVRVIGLTMHTSTRFHQAMLEVGAEKCLVKSGDFHDLVNAVHSCGARRVVTPQNGWSSCSQESRLPFAPEI